MPTKSKSTTSSSAAKAAAKGKSSTKSGATISGEDLLKKLKESSNNPALTNRPLSEKLKQAEISSPLILVSGQHLRLKRLVSLIREQLCPETDPSQGLYFGTELSSASNVQHIVGDLTSLSLFSKDELIVIFDADRAKAAAQKAIAEILPRRSPSTLLILCTESLSKGGALLTAAGAEGTAVNFPELSGSSLERWIEREVKRIGLAKGISGPAKNLLIQSYGDDVTSLAHELEKLSLLTPSGQQIELNLVESISYKKSEQTSFELVKQIASKNSLAVMAIGTDLINQGLHPLQVSAFLHRSWRTMLGMADPGALSLPSELTNPWFSKQLRPLLRSFPVERLRTGVSLLAALDFKLKDSKLPPAAVLSLTLQRLAK